MTDKNNPQYNAFIDLLNNILINEPLNSDVFSKLSKDNLDLVKSIIDLPAFMIYTAFVACKDFKKNNDISLSDIHLDHLVLDYLISRLNALKSDLDEIIASALEEEKRP